MQIREGIFETNSSSTHSFVIGRSKDNQMELIAPSIRKSPRYIGTGTYGWGPDNLMDWEERAEYMATFAVLSNKVEEFEATMSEYLRVDVKIEMPKKDEKYNWFDGADIDHQSLDTAEEMFDDLINTVFLKHGYIRIDNDNH